MSRPSCGCGSLGCLLMGLIIGALTVWFAIPLLTEKGYTPDKTAEKIDDSVEKISDYTYEKTEDIQRGSKKVKEKVSDFTGGVKKQITP